MDLPLTTPSAKPRLRGVSHQAAFYAAAGAGAMLLALAPDGRTALALSVYVGALLALFGVSALYHRIDWDAARRLAMKRLDHATIFVFIAGTYTPLCLLGLDPGSGGKLLALAWGGAGLGIVQSLVWPKAPKAVSALLYLGLGWLAVAVSPALIAALSPLTLGLIAAGGVLYSLGAGCYALQKPNPLPGVFGYHEVFHALVVAACASHFGAIAQLVLAR